MWKWILGVIAFLAIGAVCAGWYGYRQLSKFANTPPVSTITIKAPASRVFASLATGDSMSSWLDGVTVHVPHPGPLAAGDTIGFAGASTDTSRSMPWIVTEAVPNRIFAVEMVAAGQHLSIQRRDSLVDLGDSTRLISTVAAPSMDSLVPGGLPRSGVASSVGNFAMKTMMSGMRLQSDLQFARLKSHIEGTVAQAGKQKGSARR